MMMPRENRAAGYNLAEIMAALVIMAMLVGLAVPTYFRSMEQSRANEARVNLRIIYLGQQAYFTKNGTYWPPVAGIFTADDVNAGLGIEITARHYTVFEMSANGPGGYSATCRRNTVDGGAGTKWYRNQYVAGTLTADEGGSF